MPRASASASFQAHAAGGGSALEGTYEDLECRGLRLKVSRFRVQGLGFWVKGLALRVKGLGCRV